MRIFRWQENLVCNTFGNAFVDCVWSYKLLRCSREALHSPPIHKHVSQTSFFLACQSNAEWSIPVGSAWAIGGSDNKLSSASWNAFDFEGHVHILKCLWENFNKIHYYGVSWLWPDLGGGGGGELGGPAASITLITLVLNVWWPFFLRRLSPPPPPPPFILLAAFLEKWC